MHANRHFYVKSIAVLAVLLAATSTAFAVNSLGTGYHLSTSVQAISGYSTCYDALTSSGSDVFFPTNTATEWNDFVSHHPSNVTLGTCGPPHYLGWRSITSSSDGTKLAAVSDYDIYTSTDGGVSWAAHTFTDGRMWNSIASSADGTHLAAVTWVGSGSAQGSVYTSTDSGATWSVRAAAGVRVWTSIVSSADGTHLAAVGNEGDIYTSTDSGATWTDRVPTVSNLWGPLASSADGMKLVVVGKDYYAYQQGSYIDVGDIYTSTDGGVTWTDRTSSGVTHNLLWNALASSADGTHLIAAETASSVYGVLVGDIYTSTDSGVTWTARTAAGSRTWGAVASSADGMHLVAAAYNGDIYTSTDGGVTWTDRTPAGAANSKWYALASSADGMHLVAGQDAGDIYTSTDGGVTWTDRSS